MKYDFLIVGAGCYGAAFARTVMDAGYTCRVIDRREHIAGNSYSENIHGIEVHKYGAHIFHTDSEDVWQFVSQFADWVPFRNNPRALTGGRVFSFPVNMFTFHQLWGVTTPFEAFQELQRQRVTVDNPNANAQAYLLSQFGQELYELFFYGYTKKQWLREPVDLPASIVQRVPIRLTYDDSYFGDKYQAVPADGYTRMIENMLDGATVDLGVDFSTTNWQRDARFLVYTGPIDELFGHEYGRLSWRALSFTHEVHAGDYQGHAVFNHCDETCPYLRSVEHKHFLPKRSKSIDFQETFEAKTVVTYDTPVPAEQIADPQYPLRNKRNLERLEKYQALDRRHGNILVGGRLGDFRYYDMDQAIAAGRSKARSLLGCL